MPARQFVTVHIDSAAALVEKPLTYEVPKHLQEMVGVGSYVLVPLRRQRVPGYVTGISETTDIHEVKEIVDLLSEIPLFDGVLLRLGRWVARYYHCSMIEVLRTIAPSGPRARTDRTFRLLRSREEAAAAVTSLTQRAPVQAAVLQTLLTSEHPLPLAAIKKEIPHKSIGGALQRLVQRGWVEVSVTLGPRVSPRSVKGIRVAGDAEAKNMSNPRERDVLAFLESAGGTASLQELRRNRVSNAALRRLLQRGIVHEIRMDLPRCPRSMDIAVHETVALTDEQQTALETVKDAIRRATTLGEGSQSDRAVQKPEVYLIHGVTASGKTEVYLRVIDFCLQQNAQALVLLPEISLTEQTLAIFRHRFGDKVAVFHSSLSQGERFDEWNRARTGQADIVLGARSAIFAPLERLGLIIIDEEHDGSYKQESTPRYHARDVALRRAEIQNAVVVLGSATPSVESYYRAQTGKYRLIKMTRRVSDRSLPSVEIVDLNAIPKEANGSSVLSPRLREGIQDRLSKGEQVILFLNRRGFTPVIRCFSCGHVESCVHCSVSLTYHRSVRQLRCHHCNFRRHAPAICANCGAPLTAFVGIGTERVEQEIRACFLEASVIRMDRDTTTRKGSHAAMLEHFSRGRALVLIGTQMVAKGLDFAGVTLVGVILADMALYIPDFRSCERTFQLLAQVSGRAGRGDIPGEVIIQTYQPENYAICAGATQDFDAFWQKECRIRRQLPYPPFTHLANIVSSAPKDADALAKIQEVKEELTRAIRVRRGTQLIGPAPCPLGRVKDRFRWHLLLRDRNRPRLHRVLEETLDQWSPSRRQGIVIDIDPVSLM